MPDIQNQIESISLAVSELARNGKVADYIPALARVDANQFGIAVCDLDGNLHSAGSASVEFSIQSISKLFSLVQAMNIYVMSCGRG